MLADALRAKGWTVLSPRGPFRKGDWEVDFDTSHWMMVSSKGNPRVFDVPLLDAHEEGWTANLIEHLCRMEDERDWLRKAIAAIRDQTDDAVVRSVAEDALEQCYHRWLLNVAVPKGQTGSMYCPVCGAVGTYGSDPHKP